MTTVTKIAKGLGLSDTAIRKWGKDYKEFLSPGANPEEGEKREYTEDDLAVFNTISVLRSQGKEHKAIEQALKDGTRLEPLELPTEGDSPPASKGTALQIEVFSETIATYEARVNRYETKIDDLQERLLDSETARARAEAQLEILQQVTDNKISTEEKPNFWQRLFNRGN